MNDEQDSMAAFMAVFERMARQGPGSAAATREMFARIPSGERLDTILDIGCGSGAASLVLARLSGGLVTAVDTHQPFLDWLAREAAEQGLDERIRPVNMSMDALDFPAGSFDLLWAEGSAYSMGVEKALAAWRPLIRPGGWLFLNDAVWTTDTPDAECRAFWEKEYPDIRPLERFAEQARAAGYTVVSTFLQAKDDWDAYIADMERQVTWAEQEFGPSPVIDHLRREADIPHRFGAQYTYGGLLLQKTD